MLPLRAGLGTGCPGGGDALSTRRRGGVLESAIFTATLHELATAGYGAFSIEGVAATAGTGKSAIYRRWASKDELIAAALDATLPSLPEAPDTGSLRGDLLVIMRALGRLINSECGSAMRAILSNPADAEKLAVIKERVMVRRRQTMLDVVRRAVARGEARPDAVCRRVLETGPALAMHRYLSTGRPVSDSELIAIVDEILLPLIRA